MLFYVYKVNTFYVSKTAYFFVSKKVVKVDDKGLSIVLLFQQKYCTYVPIGV